MSCRQINFDDAKKACDDGSVLAMPKTQDEVNDIKTLFNRKYNDAFNYIKT